MVDATDAVEHGLDRSQHRREKRALAFEHARHEAAERNDERGEDHEIDRDLKPAIDGHGCGPFQNRSGRSRA